MKTVLHDIEGPLILREDLRLDGEVRGDVTVPSGLSVQVNGAIRGGLLLCAGASADIRGVVYGALHDEGGSYRLTGTIGGLRKSRRRRLA